MNLLALSSLLFAASIFVFMLGLSLGGVESPLLVNVFLWGGHRHLLRDRHLEMESAVNSKAKDRPPKRTARA